MTVWGVLIVVGFVTVLIYGSFKGALPVRGMPDADRKTNPVYFWAVATLYTAFVAFGVWVCSAGL